MKELDHYGSSFAQEWVWQKPRSKIKSILLAVAALMLMLCVTAVGMALWVSTDLGNVSSSAGTDLQKKIYWHSSTRD